ncbi:hypothetical protein [Hydrogenophaga sp.]|uniref:hypothetical protein n=1 Tax=Hydrogenophaga sp. TaxID=1904254 RepID=UPI0027204861|nr:hypothetical protein [Hydrogenophaga sp.]MDO9437957.1 hypothetical protein [Hydrogenophaga sp.]
MSLARTPPQETPAFTVSRWATRKLTPPGDFAESETRSLEAWRGLDAYVLLGDPGSGKSTTFDKEAGAAGTSTLKAQDIVDGVIDRIPPDSTVFIDGLDQVRAGKHGDETALGAIRAWLHRHGRPRFRLSCREIDWYGDEDVRALQMVAPTGEVAALHLDPLTAEDVQAIASARQSEVGEPDAFLRTARTLGLEPLFGNPLLLDLTIRGWNGIEQNHAQSRRDIYASACEQMVKEVNQTHARRKPLPIGGRQAVLHEAGLVCALLLLSQREHASWRTTCSHNAVDIDNMPSTLGLIAEQVDHALTSKLFTSIGGCISARHRTLAEFLAARSIAELIENKGIPLGRILALMLGEDGHPVEPLRGLLAWLAVHHHKGRPTIIRIDPLGLVVNGDVQSLPRNDRDQLLDSLREAVSRNPWLGRDLNIAQPMALLLLPDMYASVCAHLDRPERDPEHQVFVNMLMDGLAQSQVVPMPAIVSRLAHWTMDTTARISNRVAAYRAWKRHVSDDIRWPQQSAWLEQLQSLKNLGEADGVMGAILVDTYPTNIGPSEIFHYLRPLRKGAITTYSFFWSHQLLENSSNQDVALLADTWSQKSPSLTEDTFAYETWNFSGKLLARALNIWGEAISTNRLHQWLSIGLDKHGVSRLRRERKSEVASWLEYHPEQMKAVLRLAFESIRERGDGSRPWWQAEQRLHHAKYPDDWMRWMLAEAQATHDTPLAQYLFQKVARHVVEAPPNDGIPTLEEIENWVELNRHRWPEARQWLEAAWRSDLEDNWQQEQHRSNRQHLAQESVEQTKRKDAYQPYLEGFPNGSVPLGVLVDVALAHEGGYGDIRGETPIERVRNLLLSDEETARAAIRAIASALNQDTLPSADDILKLDAKKQYYPLAHAVLLAARQVSEREPQAPLQWPQVLAETLAAFHLTTDTGSTPAWYEQLAQQRADWVAPILVRYAAAKLKGKPASNIAGLHPLSDGNGQPELARLALPEILARFPVRASTESRRLLNQSLLPALRHLEPATVMDIIRTHLDKAALAPMQRLAWLVTALPYDLNALDMLAKFVGKNERRAVELGEALYEQNTVLYAGERLSVSALTRLLEVLGPVTPRQSREAHLNAHLPRHREDTVRKLLQRLAAIATQEAQQAFPALMHHPGMGSWKEEIEYYRVAQAVVLRESQYEVPSPQAVAMTLSGKAPANPADLLVLVANHLMDIQAHLRGDDTFQLRQFWRSSTSDDRKPLIENECRDVLTHLLQPLLLSVDIDVVTERRKAQDKRADVEVSRLHGGTKLYLPIEIKKEDNEHLWTAWRTQLDKLYTIHPDAQGYGLYLVLWFGVSPKPPPNRDCPTPQSAKDLEALIRDRIPTEDRHRLAVLVLDLSWPA